MSIWKELEEIFVVDDVKKFTAHSFYTSIPATKWHIKNTKRVDIRDHMVFKLIELDAPKCLDALLNKCSLFDSDYSIHGFTPLAFAINEGQVDCVKVLLKHAKNGLIHVGRPHVTGTARGLVPLLVAILCPDADRSLELVKLLVEHRPPIDLNETNLNYPNDLKCNAVMIALAQKKWDVARLLISTGDRIELAAVDNYGLTALHHAAKAGNTEVVVKLLRAGADKTVKNKSGITPSQYTLRGDIKLLIDNYRPDTIKFANRQELKKKKKTMENIKTKKSNQQTRNDIKHLSTLSIKKASSDVTNQVEQRSVEKPTEIVSPPKNKMIVASASTQCRKCHADSVQVNIVLLPCNHVCMCETCGDEARKKNRFECPICKQIVRQYIRVRF